jgi:hypothetical protein
MNWRKRGLIFTTDHHQAWMVSHSQVPVVTAPGEDRLRIYFGTRDLQNRTTTTFIEVESENPSNVVYVHDRPVLALGKCGCFDDSGAMPSWVVDHEGRQYLYYIGWNVGVTVPYRNSIGLAMSEDGGLTFHRVFDGPIMDRIPHEPHLCATPCILIEDGVWRMWYLSGVEWQIHDGRPEPYYHIKYAESQDGVSWRREGRVCIDFKTPDEGGIARPSVLKDGGVYRMWYSHRSGRDYRTNRSGSYRIGYAESSDGLDWTRKDDEVGIDVSPTGWDSEMIAYPFVIDAHGRRHMFYNGNGFGRSGVGYAVLDEPVLRHS